MDREAIISRLKARLLRDVAYVCQRDDRRWSEPIVRTLRDIREANVKAVFFGGTLRSLLLSRLRNRRLGRPRDVDIVVAGMNMEALRERFHELITRETRFGGLQLQRVNWQFDVWPIQCTWAFVQDHTQTPRFEALPYTTFFNLEAIAVDVWPSPGRPRTIYSGDDQFFEGIISRVIEINREKNPFPALCVVRALVMAYSTGFSIGPRLAQYLALKATSVSNEELEDVQCKHYGRIRCEIGTMRRWLDHITDSYLQNSQSTVALPIPRQMLLWPEEEARQRLTVYVCSNSGRKEANRSSQSMEGV